MNKVYLVGALYDDFSEGGFEVIAVATSPEKANALAETYKKENEKVDLEIREWETDKLCF